MNGNGVICFDSFGVERIPQRNKKNHSKQKCH